MALGQGSFVRSQAADCQDAPDTVDAYLWLKNGRPPVGGTLPVSAVMYSSPYVHLELGRLRLHRTVAFWAPIQALKPFISGSWEVSAVDKDRMLLRS